MGAKRIVSGAEALFPVCPSLANVTCMSRPQRLQPVKQPQSFEEKVYDLQSVLSESVKSFVSLILRGRQGKQGSVEELAGSEFLHRKPQAHSTSVAHPRPREAGAPSACAVLSPRGHSDMWHSPECMNLDTPGECTERPGKLSRATQPA